MLRRVAAEVHRLAVGQHDLGARHVVDGEAVLQAVRAARVLGDIAADGADLLPGRVGGVSLAVRGGFPGDRQVDNAGFDDHPGVVGVDGQDPAQPRQHDEHAAGDRDRATGQARARAAGHERYACRGAQPYRLDHVVPALREHHDRGAHAEGGEAVALVGPELGGLGEDLLRADAGAECRGDPVGAARLDGGSSPSASALRSLPSLRGVLRSLTWVLPITFPRGDKSIPDAGTMFPAHPGVNPPPRPARPLPAPADQGLPSKDTALREANPRARKGRTPFREGSRLGLSFPARWGVGGRCGRDRDPRTCPSRTTAGPSPASPWCRTDGTRRPAAARTGRA